VTQRFRDDKRVRIYARDTPRGSDSPACVYCGRAVIVGMQPGDSPRGLLAATLDHVSPRGGNRPDEVVTACWHCNASKGQLEPEDWEERGGGVWLAERTPPARTLAGRIMAAISKPLCGKAAGACNVVVGRLADERVENAFAQRRRRRR